MFRGQTNVAVTNGLYIPSCIIRKLFHQFSVSSVEVNCSESSVLPSVFLDPLLIGLEYPFGLMRTVNGRNEPDRRSTRLLEQRRWGDPLGWQAAYWPRRYS